MSKITYRGYTLSYLIDSGEMWIYASDGEFVTKEPSIADARAAIDSWLDAR